MQEDYLRLVRTIGQWFPDRPIVLGGVSEGAGLSILAAADRRVAAEVTGVIGLGTPDTVTLGWHFWNWTVWVTHKEPDEPSVPTAPYLAALAPTPVLLVHATHDEYAPGSHGRGVVIPEKARAAGRKGCGPISEREGGESE